MTKLLSVGDVTQLFNCACGAQLSTVAGVGGCELRHGTGEAARLFTTIEYDPTFGWDMGVRAWLDKVHAYEAR